MKPKQKETPTVRFPFRVKIYDEKCRGVETPPVWLEFPEPPNDGGWDWLIAVEAEAKKIFLADLECCVDWDEHRLACETNQSAGAESPNAETERTAPVPPIK